MDEAYRAAERRQEARRIPGIVVIGVAYPSETAALDALSGVFVEFVDVLDRRRDRAPAGTDLSIVVDDFLDQLIVWIRSMTANAPPSRAFATHARAAVLIPDWCRRSPMPARAVAPRQHPQQNDPPASRPDDRSPLMSLRTGARQLGMHEDTLLRNYKDRLRKVRGRWKISQAVVDQLRKEDPQIRSRIR